MRGGQTHTHKKKTILRYSYFMTGTRGAYNQDIVLTLDADEVAECVETAILLSINNS